MSTEANAAALSEFWNSDAPMSQVRENMTPDNGWYDITIVKLDPSMDDNGLVFIQGEFSCIASATPGAKMITHKERLYIGTHKDPSAALPETRLNAPGFARLKGIARVCDVPTNDQKVAALLTGLIGKSFTNRIETKAGKKKDGSATEYTNFGRNPVKLGTVPAKLDATQASAPMVNGQAGSVATSTVPAGATFGD